MLLRDRKVIVTGGPTVESIDPVRFISNRSTGKMGKALADEAAVRARETVFIHGPVHESLIDGVEYRTIAIESTEELLEAVKGELAPDAVLVMAAAPADYRPAKKSPVKIKKKKEELVLRLVKNPDILRTVASIRSVNPAYGGVFLAGFAAETNNLEEYALAKLREKDLDMICVNDVGRSDAGFGVNTNIVTVFMRGGERMELPLMSKRDTASRILDCVEEGLTKKTTQLLT